MGEGGTIVAGSKMIVEDIIELKKPNSSVTLIEAKEIIEQLELELKKTTGIGLAAPQIGIHKTVAIVRSGTDSINLVNPIILERKNPFVSKEEGCLSFPEKRFNVLRYKEIFAKDDLHPDGFVATGFLATVIEHEIDHVYQTLLIDKVIDKRIGRNDPCPCGAMKDGRPIKFKNCHGRN